MTSCDDFFPAAPTPSPSDTVFSLYDSLFDASYNPRSVGVSTFESPRSITEDVRAECVVPVQERVEQQHGRRRAPAWVNRSRAGERVGQSNGSPVKRTLKRK